MVAKSRDCRCDVYDGSGFRGIRLRTESHSCALLRNDKKGSRNESKGIDDTAGRPNCTGESVSVAARTLTHYHIGALPVCSGSLMCFDSANDAYQLSSGKVTVAQTVNLQMDVTAPNGNRYIALAENGSYTFPRLNLELKTVTLRTNKAGIYYKAEMVCDEALAAQIDRHGVAVSVIGIPESGFAADPNVGYTEILGAPESIFTSGSIVNIFREGMPPEKNARRGEMKIYANPYLKLKDGTILMAQEGAAYSLYDVMSYLNTNFETLDAQTQGNAKNFYSTWADSMAAWKLEKLAS